MKKYRVMRPEIRLTSTKKLYLNETISTKELDDLNVPLKTIKSMESLKWLVPIYNSDDLHDIVKTNVSAEPTQGSIDKEPIKRKPGAGRPQGSKNKTKNKGKGKKKVS